MEERNTDYLATLFLLTADKKLWSAAKEHIYLDCDSGHFDYESNLEDYIDFKG